MEILCECGHKAHEHDEEGCMYWHTLTECNCNLSKETVEARYWWNFYQEETYRLRGEFIADDRCPDCLGDLLREDVGLPDGNMVKAYRCCSCNKLWTYYGKDLTSE